eukprot:jgi/Chrzof1/11811/Cz06g10280.t1
MNRRNTVTRLLLQILVRLAANFIVRQCSVVWYQSSILQLVVCNPTATKPFLHSTITTINGSTVNALLAHT